MLPLSYGQVTYYNTFINLRFLSYKKKETSWYTIKRRSDLLSICLLLCGDIHHCPGPNDISDYPNCNESDYKVFQKRGLHFLHINVRSLLPKLHELNYIARTSRPAFLCITWLDDTVPDSEIDIENYFVQRKDRNRQVGGVCIYIRKDLSFNNRSDLNHADLEAT